MEQAPRADGPPVGECSVEQANRERPDGDLVITGEARGESPVPFAVPERLAVVDSTNRYLVSLVGAGMPDGSAVPEGYAVVADHQSDGRGRLGRRWEAPPGTAVLCSILLKPDIHPEQLHLATWAVALAAVRACRAAAGVELSLKWPNDLIAGPGSGSGSGSGPGSGPGGGGTKVEPLAGRAVIEPKVAGILSETLPPRTEQGPGGRVAGSPRGIVVGIGLNVNWPEDWPPVGSQDKELAFIAASATALNRIAGRRIDRDELVGELLRNIGTWNAMLASQEGRRAVASQYRLGCATIGREVRVELMDETVTGKALDVDDAGCLLVSTGTCVRTIHVGDVVHVR
jgi:BirA family biotin operon repressor/biotin-[acetyl-CoA-carboxylase] ligase